MRSSRLVEVLKNAPLKNLNLFEPVLQPVRQS
jgi:hypothetical protein